MSSVAELFDAYAAAYARGEQPAADEYLAEAGEGADELAALIDRFVMAAPAPAASDDQVELFEGWLAGESPLLRLRVARGVTRDRLVAALIERLGLNPAKKDKVKRYYHQLESGQLDEAGVAPTVFEALAAELGARVRDLLAWRPRAIGVQTVYLRAADAEAPASTAAPPAELELDEVDRLFRSGR